MVIFSLLHLLCPNNDQPEVLNQRFRLIGLLRIKELCRQQVFPAVLLAAFTSRAELLPDEPVSDIDVDLNVLGGGIPLQNGAHGHVEVRELRQLLNQGGVAIDIRIGHNLPALQHQQPLVDHGLAAGGQPQETAYLPRVIFLIVLRILRQYRHQESLTRNPDHLKHHPWHRKEGETAILHFRRLRIIEF